MVGSACGWQSQSTGSRGQIGFSWRLGYNQVGSRLAGCSPGTNRLHLVGSVGGRAPPAWPAHNSFLQKRNSLCSSSYCVTSSSSNLDILFVCENHAEPPEMGINVYGAFFARSRSVLLTFFPTGEWRAEGVVPWGSPCNWQGSCAQSFFLWSRLKFSPLPLLSLKLIGSISQG